MSRFTIVLAILLIGCLFTFTIAKKEANELTTVIGIDLGTTSSCVGVYMDKDVQIIPNEQGNRITPSMVAFTDFERLIGEAAENQAIKNPKRTIFNVKRLIGRRFRDKEVQGDLELIPYRIVNKGGKPYIQVNVLGKTRLFSPEQISAMILTKMKETAEAFLGNKIKDAVIAVPAYFKDAQRQATMDAAVIAGLNVVRIVNEPTAAAFAYELHKEEGMRKILVFDLGGGTFDASVVSIEYRIFVVLATNGDSHLGGEDFTQRIVDHFVNLIKKKHGKNISSDIRLLEKLRREAERAKRALSSQHQVRVEIESPFDDVELSESLTRARFEELNKDLFRKTIEHVKKAMEISGVEKHEIDEIVLVGGSTRIPKVRQLLRDYFDGKELNEDVNPDEAVASGAAIQGAILSGVDDDETKWTRLMDVVPVALNVEADGQGMTRLFIRNEYIPNGDILAFTTSQDQQTAMSINVYEQETNLADDCRHIATYVVSGIPPAPRGTKQIKVAFSLDANGILELQAYGNSEITSTKKGRSSQKEIERMVKEGEELAEEEKKAKEKSDAYNALEIYLFNLRSQINDSDKLAGKFESDEKGKLETATKEALEWLDDNDTADKEDFDDKLKEVEAVFSSLIEASCHKKKRVTVWIGRTFLMKTTRTVWIGRTFLMKTTRFLMKTTRTVWIGRTFLMKTTRISVKVAPKKMTTTS